MVPKTIVAVGGVLAVAAGSVTVPPPEGPLPVGRTRWVVTDSDRTDPFEPAHPRRIEVVAWYPTERTAGGAPAPYLLEGADEVRRFASLLGNAGLLDELATITAHAKQDAPPRPGRDRLPLLLFS